MCEKSFRKIFSLDHHKLNTHTAMFKCHKCHLQVQSSEILNLHNESKHSKSPTFRNLVMQLKSEENLKMDEGLIRGGAILKCEECGNISRNKEDILHHIEDNHGDNQSTDKTHKKKHKSDVVNMETEDFKVNSYPEDDPEPQGLTIKGKSKPYLKAYNSLKLMMKKGLVYHIGGRKIYVKDVDVKFKGGVNVEIEITTKNGKAGKAKLTIYKKGKKPTATIQISKKEDGFKFQKILSMKIITPLLEGFISGEVTRKTITQYKKGPLETPISKRNKESKENYFLCNEFWKKFLLN